jgi:ribosomal protein L40E
MICPRCNAENPAGGKFCGACGSTLGSVCSRCGNVSEPNDRFCSSCGLAAGDVDLSISPRLPSPVKQYTPQEIEELLILKRSMRKAENAAKTLNQDEVDKLFE